MEGIRKNESISKETEKKRLDDLEKIAQNWDQIPEYARGKLDGIISAYTAVFLPGDTKKVG